ncbi:MAG: flagellar filament capping protein FliD [Burkholderiales bacterium]
MAISAPGIGSGLDVNSIVTQLLALERRPLTLLDRSEAGFQAKLSAYGSLKSALSAFQTSLKSLSDISKYQTLTATTSDSAVFTATASSSATPGSYAIEVNALAQAQKLAAAGQASDNAAIGTGTLTFDFGTISGGSFDSVSGTYTGAVFASNGNGTKTVTIDAAHNSLQGIRDAINQAGIGVTATLINDGGTAPFRLALTSNNSGVANSIKIAVSGDAALSNLLAHDPAGTQNLSQKVTAQNAALKIDGVSVSKASNTISDVIAGVTLSLLKTNSAAPATLSVGRDTATVKSSVEAFVKAFNDLTKTLQQLTSFNADTKEAGLLQGDFTGRSIQPRIRGLLGAAIPGLSGGFTTLSAAGVAFQKDGTLAVDATKLQSALNTNFNDIAGLFAAVSKPTDSLVSFVGSTDKTTPGSYALIITQLATKGTSVASQAAGLTITAGVNDALNVTVDGVATAVTLTAGTYTASALAIESQSRINGASAYSSAGISISVTQSAGVLTITSNHFGSASNASITGGNGKTNLVGATETTTAGLDVAGTLGGQTATGSGQFLTGGAGSAAEGLQIQINGGSTGDRGVISHSQGYAYQLDKLLQGFLSTNGAIDSRTRGITRSIDSIADRREVFNRRLVDVELHLRAQFASLDTLISKLTQTGNFLTQQLQNLSTLNQR